ncbi:MAG: hypothetical protein ACMXX5_02075 [Candidatus Woesearchaeota archaeon]
MQKTTTELTVNFIKEHPDIRNCLKKGLINYSSLAKFIAKELNIEKKTSKEAILIAARRFKEKLKDDLKNDELVKKLFLDSHIEIKNKIDVIIFDKMIEFDIIDDINHMVRKENGTFWIFEGSDNYTSIIQEKYANFALSKLKRHIIQHHKSLSLINFKTSRDIENLRGVIAYITSLFAENGINIIEFFSCWNDTVFVIMSEDVQKAMEFLRF